MRPKLKVVHLVLPKEIASTMIDTYCSVSNENNIEEGQKSQIYELWLVMTYFVISMLVISIAFSAIFQWFNDWDLLKRLYTQEIDIVNHFNYSLFHVVRFLEFVDRLHIPFVTTQMGNGVMNGKLHASPSFLFVTTMY